MELQYWRYGSICFQNALPFGRNRQSEAFYFGLWGTCDWKRSRNSHERTTANTEIRIKEFTVAPQVNPEKGLPYHEWLIEFDVKPKDKKAFEARLDAAMEAQNVYYQDLIQGNVLRPLVVTEVANQGFQSYMKSIGKLGGQNKVPRLSNDRKIADALQKATRP